MAKYGMFKYGTQKYGFSKVLPPFIYPRNIKEIEDYPICKVQILDKSENLVFEVDDRDIISIDTTSTNQSGQRLTATVVLNNENNQFTPKYKGKIWIQSMVRIMTGQMIKGIPKYYSRGVYVINDVTLTDNLSQETITINLSDKMSLLNGQLSGILQSNYIIPTGTSIIEALKAVLTAAGENHNPFYTYTNITTYYNLTVEIGSTYEDIIKSLAEMVSYQYGYDKNGYFFFSPPIIDPMTGLTNQASVYDFDENDDVYYLGSTHKYDFAVFNKIIVIGENYNGHQVQQEASDTYIFSDKRIALIGERVKIINDENIYEDDLALQRANFELLQSVIMDETCDISCHVIDDLEINKIVTLPNAITLKPEKYLVNSISYSFNNLSMTVGIWKIRQLS